MRNWTLSRRILFALLGVAAVGLITAPLLTWGWGGVVVAIVFQVGVVWGTFVWLRGGLEEPHQHFLTVLADLRANVPLGRRGMVLKSERPPDSIGLLATEINALGEATATRVARLMEQNQELEQNKTLFQSILGTMIEGVLVLDGQARVLYFNKAACRILDCASRNLPGRPLWEVVRHTDLQSHIAEVFESGTDVRREVEFLRSRSVVELTAVRLALQPEPGVVVVLHDVTSLRQLERMRREFVSNVSHELKTPLTSIQAYADTLLDGALDDQDNSRVFISRILEQSDRLQQLIQDMLRLARIESQSEAFSLGPVDLAATLKDCLDARQTIAQSREISLQLDSGDRTVQVRADLEGLKAIIENLLSNALNHTPSGGQVHVRWYREQQRAVIEVEDTGIGIPAEHHERIFERFYRVDKARSRGRGGTGLGLAIVKHVTQVMGGTISLKSQPGQGSRFIVRLPLAEESSPPSHSEPIKERGSGEAF